MRTTTNFIWKKSVIDNGFRCPKCKKLLFKNDEPTKNLGIDGCNIHDDEGDLFCIGCRNLVGRYVIFNFNADELFSQYGINMDDVTSMQETFIEFMRIIQKQEEKIKKLTSIKNDIRDFEAIIKNLEIRNSALKDKIKSLEKQNSNMAEAHRVELKKCDNEINRLYNLLEGKNESSK